MADAALDALGAERGFVLVLAFAPLLRAVRVADRHAHDRDRRVDAAHRRDAGNAASRADDHLPPDLLTEDPVRRADVAGAFRGDRCSLQSQARLTHGLGRLVDDRVLRRSAIGEREVVAREVELGADDVRRNHAERFLEQLLPGLVSLQHDDRLPLHGGGLYALRTLAKFELLHFKSLFL